MGKETLENFIAESNAASGGVTPPDASPSLSGGGTPVSHAQQKVSPAQAAQQQAATQRAQAKQAAAQQKAYDRAQRQAQQKQATQQQAALKLSGKAVSGVSSGITTTTEGVVSGVADVAGSVSDWAASRPTPGGILVILLVIFIFLWLIIPVNGSNTRAKLLWKVLFEQNMKVSGAQPAPSSTQAFTQPSSTNVPTASQMSSALPGVVSTVVDFGGGV